MDINPWYECEKLSKFEWKNIFELSIPCERAHCKLQKNVRIVRIRHSKLKLWLIESLECESTQQGLSIWGVETGGFIFTRGIHKKIL